jgi:hypothetical protein
LQSPKRLRSEARQSRKAQRTRCRSWWTRSGRRSTLPYRFDLIDNDGPASSTGVPKSTASAVGAVKEVVVAPMPSFTRLGIITCAVLVVLQVPVAPALLHCALAWLAAAAVPSTIAARSKRVAFIVLSLQGSLDGAGYTEETGPFKALSAIPYKTRIDLICNGFLERISTFRAIDKTRRRLFGLQA